MTDIVFRLYSLAHIIAKLCLGRHVDSALKFPISSYAKRINSNYVELWKHFIDSSTIPEGNNYEGFHYAGYILEKKEWCLPSWIWTNAAIVRMYSSIGCRYAAVILAEKMLSRQEECGGWIVRNDYDSKGAIPMLAPNDSAYIANNAMIAVYYLTKEQKFLDSAIRCAKWIMDTTRRDTMVYTGYNMRDKIWDTRNIIVDVGFTAGLFSSLYEITKDDIYKNFLQTFCHRYIELFFISDKNGFATSIDSNDRPQGGMFSRGQAWALEGLIPAFKVLHDNSIKEIIIATINTLLANQNKDGSWPYNLTRKLMGNDCKGVAIIAKSLIDWYNITGEKHLLSAAKRALNWCQEHTSAKGDSKGGIFSFCTEGAIVKDLYSSCAFVYASAYAIELNNTLSNESK